MKISNSQIEAILTTKGSIAASQTVDTAVIRLVDKDLVEYTSRKVLAMPDREEMIESIRARIEAGEYHVSGEDIADAMIRRAIADRVS